MHPVLLLALAPERDPDVADSHRLGDASSPARLEPRPEGRLAPSRLTGDEHPLDAALPEIDAALGRRLEQMGGIRRSEHRGFGPQKADRKEQALGVARADRDVAEPDPIERRERSAGDERAGVVRRDDSLAGRDPGRGVAPRRPVTQSSRSRLVSGM